MSYCDECVRRKLCDEEGLNDPAMVYCAKRIINHSLATQYDTATALDEFRRLLHNVALRDESIPLPQFQDIVDDAWELACETTFTDKSEYEDGVSRAEVISQLQYCLANYDDYEQALKDTLNRVKHARSVTVHPQQVVNAILDKLEDKIREYDDWMQEELIDLIEKFKRGNLEE